MLKIFDVNPSEVKLHIINRISQDYFHDSYTALEVSKSTITSLQLNLVKSPHFYYKGELYFSPALSKKPDYKPKKLHPDLYQMMDDFLLEKEKMLDKQTYIDAYINDVIDHCNIWTDLLLILPKYLHPPIRHIAFEPITPFSDGLNELQQKKIKDKLAEKHKTALFFYKKYRLTNMLKD